MRFECNENHHRKQKKIEKNVKIIALVPVADSTWLLCYSLFLPNLALFQLKSTYIEYGAQTNVFHTSTNSVLRYRISLRRSPISRICNGNAMENAFDPTKNYRKNALFDLPLWICFFFSMSQHFITCDIYWVPGYMIAHML